MADELSKDYAGYITDNNISKEVSMAMAGL
jgi:hypothetical protein